MVLGLAVPKLAALELTGEALIHVTQLSGWAWANARRHWTAMAPRRIRPQSGLALGDYERRPKADTGEIHVVLRTL
jgi:hypothetical protein